MFRKSILSIVCICLLSPKAHSQCALWSFFTGLSATASNCLSGPNLGSYEVTGTLSSLASFPSTGTLTFSNGNGQSVTYNAPFTSPVNYTLPATAGHGNSYTVTASFSDYACTKQRSYLSPICCSVTISNTTPSICESETLTLTTTGTSGGNYFWIGPGGFSSTQQNPTIPNIPISNAGLYQVYLVNGSCTSPPDSATVNVKPKPAQKTIIPE